MCKSAVEVDRFEQLRQVPSAWISVTANLAERPFQSQVPGLVTKLKSTMWPAGRKES